MAEEEVLEQPIVSAKKDKGGGVTFVHLIVVALIMVVVTIVCFVSIQKFLGVSAEDLKRQVAVVGVLAGERVATSDMVIRNCKEEGKESKDKIVALSKDPIIVNMADGEHFISMKIALCIDTEKLTEEAFPAKTPQLTAIVNDALSRVAYYDLFPGASAKAEAGGAAMPAGSVDNNAYAQKVNEINANLTRQLAVQTNAAVKEVYFESFLVQ